MEKRKKKQPTNQLTKQPTLNKYTHEQGQRKFTTEYRRKCYLPLYQVSIKFLYSVA